MTNSYLKGRNLEYEVKNILKQAGFHTVIRSSKSHTPVDLIAVKLDEIVFVQVKFNHSSVKQALCDLRDFNPQMKGVKCEVWKRLEGHRNKYEIYDLRMLQKCEWNGSKLPKKGVPVDERYFRNR